MDSRQRSSHFLVVLSSLLLCYSSCEPGFSAKSAVDERIIFDKVEDFVHIRQRREAEQNKTVYQNQTIKDDHTYYISEYLKNGASVWNELEGHEDSITHWKLTNGTIKYAQFQLKFQFPFYGHPVEKISITTEGFLYLGWVFTRFDIMRQVMYIAPLMAYFIPVFNESSAIYYISNDTQFTVQWTNIYLAEDKAAGPFTFQCTLFKTGRIHFAYKHIPKNVSDINGTNVQAVRVGLSDAFTVIRYHFKDGVIIVARVFYRYHTIELNQTFVQSGSAFIISPKPNCISARSCDACRNVSEISEFNCKWCNRLQRCSDSVDRHRVEWFLSRCNRYSVITKEECSALVPPTGTILPPVTTSNHRAVVATDNKSRGISAGAIVGVCLALVIVIGVAAWCFFAYTHPTSSSGLFLISLRYKPRELFRRGGEENSGSGGGVAVQGSTKSSTLA